MVGGGGGRVAIFSAKEREGDKHDRKGCMARLSTWERPESGAELTTIYLCKL